jgi:hypothetical protein
MQLLPSLLFVSSRIQVNGKDVLMYPTVAARSEIGFNLALSLSVRYHGTITKNIKKTMYINIFFYYPSAIKFYSFLTRCQTIELLC